MTPEHKTKLQEFVHHLRTTQKSSKEYRAEMANVLEEIANSTVTTVPPISYDPPATNHSKSSETSAAEDALFTLADIVTHHAENWKTLAEMYESKGVLPPTNFPVLMAFALRRLHESLIEGKRFEVEFKKPQTITWKQKK